MRIQLGIALCFLVQISNSHGVISSLLGLFGTRCIGANYYKRYHMRLISVTLEITVAKR